MRRTLDPLRLDKKEREREGSSHVVVSTHPLSNRLLLPLLLLSRSWYRRIIRFVTRYRITLAVYLRRRATRETQGGKILVWKRWSIIFDGRFYGREFFSEWKENERDDRSMFFESKSVACFYNEKKKKRKKGISFNILEIRILHEDNLMSIIFAEYQKSFNKNGRMLYNFWKTSIHLVKKYVNFTKDYRKKKFLWKKRKEKKEEWNENVSNLKLELL